MEASEDMVPSITSTNTLNSTTKS